MGTMRNPDEADVLARYVRDGRLRQYPARAQARDIILRWLAGQFAPSVHYSEAEVNERLAGHAVDHATLRRYLVDAGLLGRMRNVYWRTQGEDHSSKDFVS